MIYLGWVWAEHVALRDGHNEKDEGASTPKQQKQAKTHKDRNGRCHSWSSHTHHFRTPSLFGVSKRNQPRPLPWLCHHEATRNHKHRAHLLWNSARQRSVTAKVCFVGINKVEAEDIPNGSPPKLPPGCLVLVRVKGARLGWQDYAQGPYPTPLGFSRAASSSGAKCCFRIWACSKNSPDMIVIVIIDHYCRESSHPWRNKTFCFGTCLFVKMTHSIPTVNESAAAQYYSCIQNAPQQNPFQ